MVVRVVGSVVRHGILREGALGNVHPHTAQVQRGVRSACLHPRSAVPSPAAGHLAASAAAADQLLIQFVVQRAIILVAVQSIVQPGWIQVVIGVLEGEEAVFCEQARTKFRSDGSFVDPESVVKMSWAKLTKRVIAIYGL